MVYAMVPTEEGIFISEGFLNLSEIIMDYDHNLELRWIPTDKRTRDDKEPYVIWDKLTNSAVIYATELDTPEGILTKLWLSDNKTTDQLQRIEIAEAAAEALRLKERMESMEEAHDKAGFLIKTPLHTVRLIDPKTGEKYKLDSNRRRMG